MQEKFSLFLVHLLFNSDPGDLELIMMHKGFLVGEVDKLLQYPEYSQVLLMEVSEEKDLPPKKKESTG